MKKKCLIKHYAMKLYQGVDIYLDGSEWLASFAVRFNPEESSPGTEWIGCCVKVRAGLDAMEKRKIRRPCRN
jgi:hypothetical protein